MITAQTPNTNKLKLKVKSDSQKAFNFTLLNNEDTLTFIFEDSTDFPFKIYELTITLKELKEKEHNFLIFINTERLINGIKSCIELDKYSLKLDEEENALLFEIKNEFFEKGVAGIKINQKEQDLKIQVESLTKVVANLKEELKKYENLEEELAKKFDKKSELEKLKDETAINSFEGTSFLNNDEKKLISKWISPNRVIKFNLLFSTNKNGDSSSTFHYYCDGVFPTVTVVVDTSGRRFGGYSTQNWCQSTVGANYATAPDSFIFSLSNKQKYGLVKFNTNGIYRNNSYGPVFGGGHDLCLANSCRSNTSSYCSKSSYETGNNNLLGNTGSTSFQVSYYEVYQVIFE